MSAFTLMNGTWLVVRTESICCAADLDLPGRARLVGENGTIARGLAALRAAWPHLLPETRKAAVLPADPEPKVAPDWSNASVADIAMTQPEVLRRSNEDPGLAHVLETRTAGDEIGWRSTAEQLRDAGFVPFSLNQPTARSEDGETRDAFLSDADRAAAPVAGTISRAWGTEYIEQRWLQNGPIVRVSRLRDGRVSAICNAYGTVHTVTFTEPSGRTKTLPHLTDWQYSDALVRLPKAGCQITGVQDALRWYRRPLPQPVIDRAVARFLEVEPTFVPLAERKHRRPTPAHRVVTPAPLRFDLDAEKAYWATEDRSQEEEPVTLYRFFLVTRKRLAAKYAVLRSGEIIETWPERVVKQNRLVTGWLTEDEASEWIATRRTTRNLLVETEVQGPTPDSCYTADFGAAIAHTGCI